MSTSGESFKKVRYDLRPAKQVERMMLVDAFQCLAIAGFPISDYRYVGMGSVHFYDYSLLHKYLGIEKLVSVELSTSIQKRVEFNRPFLNVDLKIGAIGDVIPTLSRDEKHILWLDYDTPMQSAFVADVTQATTDLSPGSIMLITVDVDPPKNLSKPADLRRELSREVGDALPTDLPLASFRPHELHVANLAIIARAIERGLRGRRGISFVPTFSFLYKDGHKMLTVGGVIAGADEGRRVSASTLPQRIYFRGTLKDMPYTIHVPVLTRKEKLYLDQNMPSVVGWVPTEFELSLEDLRAYREIYRFCPLYAELFM